MARAEYTPPPLESDTYHAIDLNDHTRVFVGAGMASSALRGQDAGCAIVEKSVFAVCDGVSSAHAEGTKPDGPRIAAQVGSAALCELAADIPTIDTPNEAYLWAQDAMNIASGRIEQAGGTIATALLAVLTQDRVGIPHMLLASRGDSRALSYPQVAEGLRGRTRDHLAFQVRTQDVDDWLGQALQVARAKDGACPYELFTVEDGELTTWIGTPDHQDNVVQTRYIPLEYNQRRRFALASDGIFGSEHFQYLSEDVVAYGMSRGTPQQAADFFMQQARAHDDRFIYTFDVGAQFVT